MIAPLLRDLGQVMQEPDRLDELQTLLVVLITFHMSVLVTKLAVYQSNQKVLKNLASGGDEAETAI